MSDWKTQISERKFKKTTFNFLETSSNMGTWCRFLSDTYHMINGCWNEINPKQIYGKTLHKTVPLINRARLGMAQLITQRKYSDDTNGDKHEVRVNYIPGSIISIINMTFHAS